MSEEATIIAEENNPEVLTSFNRIPYAIIDKETEGSTKDVQDELTAICGFYKIYKKGAKFTVEGTNGDYVPAQLRYKMAASIVNKEARFLFAEPPTITVEPKGDIGKTTDDTKDAITTINDVVKTILDANKFEDGLIKAAKDCFIGRRVASLINFNEEDGVSVIFLPSTQFIYETKVGNNNVLTKFVAFIVTKESVISSEKRIFVKKYEVIEDVVYLEEIMYDGSGKEQETVTEFQDILLPRIPAVIFVNDGLTSEMFGESEIETLSDYESWYSKLANADIDAERKSMNPIRYTTDMDSRSTKGLSSSAGAYWDLQSDQNLDKPKPTVGTLENAMTYSESLKTTLDRIKTAGYEQIDMPNISLETMSGVMTSGKSLKAIYWPLIVRCKEKMKMWGPQLRETIDIIIQGSIVYPNCITEYSDNPIVSIPYDIKVEQNLPLLEDEIEEKTIDLSEVDSMTMSRKAYMMKWRQLTEDEAKEELDQIALELQAPTSSFNANGENTGLPYPDGSEEQDPVIDETVDNVSKTMKDNPSEDDKGKETKKANINPFRK